MDTETEYKILNSLDAQKVLWNILKSYFSTHKHKYKYSEAYMDYKTNIGNHPYTTSKRLFKVMAGTSLVTDKEIMTNRTQQGTFYHIRKAYLKKIDRDINFINFLLITVI